MLVTQISKRTVLMVAALLTHFVFMGWAAFFVPVILALPEDFSLTFDVVSTDNFYDPERQAFVGAIHSKTDFRYESIAKKDGVSIIKNTFSVSTLDNDPIFAVERLYGVDSVTTEHQAAFGDKERNGFLFAPRHLRAGDSFTYWHVNYDGPATMEYVRTERVHGVRAFVYQADYSGVKIDQTENLTYLEGVGETKGVELEPSLELWIEPYTGRLIFYKDKTTAYFYDLQTGQRLYPWNKFSNMTDAASVEHMAMETRLLRTKMRLVEYVVPILLFIVTVTLFLRGIGLCTAVQRCINGRRIMRLSSIILAVSAALNIYGWIFNQSILILQIGSGSAMNPLTAICFSLMSLLIVAYFRKLQKITIAIGLFISTLAAMHLMAQIGFMSPIDILLLGDRVLEFQPPARMTVTTAIIFFILGIVPLCRMLPLLRQIQMGQILSLTVLIMSVYAVLGYVFDTDYIVHSSTFSSESLLSTVLFIVTSITFAVVMQSKGEDVLSLKSQAWLSIVLGFSISITYVFADTVDSNFTDDARRKFAVETDRIMEQFDERFSIYINALEGGRGFFAASDLVERDEWKTYVEAIETQKNFPGIQGIGYTEFVTPENKQKYISRIREEGFPSFTIRPEGERDLYTSITFLEPFDERNKQAFGFDMFQEPIRRFAMEQARDSGEPRISGKITLVQEIDKDVQPGFLIYVPVYKNNVIHDTLEQRRSSIVGYVYSPFRVRDFIRGTVGNAIEDIGMRIHDGVEMEQENEYFNDVDTVIEPSQNPRFVVSRTFYVAGRPWVFTFYSSAKYGITPIGRFAPILISIIGIVFSILVTLIFYTLVSSREKAVKYADSVTADLREANAKDEALLQSIGDGIVAVDQNERVIFANQAAEKLLGWKISEMKEKHFSDLVQLQNADGNLLKKEDRPITKAAIYRKKTQLTVVDNVSYIRKDGTMLPVTITVTPIQVGKKYVGAIEVFRDVTKEADFSKRQSEFMSVASHQLRTPMTALRWSLELLAKGSYGKISKKQQEIIQPAIGYANSLAETIRTMLISSRADSGSVQLNIQEVHLDGLITEIVKEHEYWYVQKNIRIEKKLDKDVVLKTDQSLLKEIIGNLVNNAIRYSPEGSTIGIAIKRHDENVEISIKDEGIGIPDDAKGHIFTKFFRAENARKKVTDGTGLGLYLCYTLVTLLKGELTFVSVKDKGTTFTILLPHSPTFDV